MELIKEYFPELTPEQEDRFEQLEDLYRYWNARINLISRRDLDEFYERHVLHSLSIAKCFKIASHIKVVDIGTGGGFPGIPLAILYPDTEFVLVDSIGKKIKIVQQVIEQIKLGNAKAVHTRAEDMKPQKFDLALSRAVAPLSTLNRWAQQILTPKNQGLICLKGGDLSREIKEAGGKTICRPIKDYFDQPFFETKMVIWSEIRV